MPAPFDVRDPRPNAEYSPCLRPDPSQVANALVLDSAEDCLQQTRLVSTADAADSELGSFLDAAFVDLVNDAETAGGDTT
ncbi:hypothetical protein FHS81_000162 [Pseudochelatococcus contaminans]|uniref:Uncharacterized protein n=1 Tax=Pseudochelatococcus contaminans TaxID=1538103 RepID=A0A7W5Z178_9HYPH|nr:hypothetical protein [Pseudochelatococcus contaminans]